MQPRTENGLVFPAACTVCVVLRMYDYVNMYVGLDIRGSEALRHACLGYDAADHASFTAVHLRLPVTCCDPQPVKSSRGSKLKV